MAPKPVRLVRKVGRPVKKNPVGRPQVIFVKSLLNNNDMK